MGAMLACHNYWHWALYHIEKVVISFFKFNVMVFVFVCLFVCLFAALVFASVVIFFLTMFAIKRQPFFIRENIKPQWTFMTRRCSVNVIDNLWFIFVMTNSHQVTSDRSIHDVHVKLEWFYANLFFNSLITDYNCVAFLSWSKVGKRCHSGAMLDLVDASSLLYRLQMEGNEITRTCRCVVNIIICFFVDRSFDLSNDS